MTKLQKQINKELGDKIYFKYVIIINPEMIKQLEWKEGDILLPTASKKGLNITNLTQLDKIEDTSK